MIASLLRTVVYSPDLPLRFKSPSITKVKSWRITWELNYEQRQSQQTGSVNIDKLTSNYARIHVVCLFTLHTLKLYLSDEVRICCFC